MRPFAESGTKRWLAAALVLLLSACGATRRDDGGLPPIIEPGTTPAPATTPVPARPGAQPQAPGTQPVPPPVVDKGNPDQRFTQALEMLRGNQISEAEAAFQSLSGDFPEYAGAWTNLGIIYAKSNRRDAALGALSRAVSINKRNAVAQNWLGMLYREARDYSRAERSYNAALDAQPGYGLAHLNLGILYDEYLRRPLDALPHYKAYLQNGGKDDLRVLAWIAEIEKPQTAAPAAPKPAAPGPAPVVEPRR